MEGAPNAVQEIILCNVIYFGSRQGRENLQNMKRNTFALDVDPDGHRYIHQVIKELDKNHIENDLQPSNEARLYEIPGKTSFFFCLA